MLTSKTTLTPCCSLTNEFKIRQVTSELMTLEDIHYNLEDWVEYRHAQWIINVSVPNLWILAAGVNTISKAMSTYDGLD